MLKDVVTSIVLELRETIRVFIDACFWGETLNGVGVEAGVDQKPDTRSQTPSDWWKLSMRRELKDYTVLIPLGSKDFESKFGSAYGE